MIRPHPIDPVVCPACGAEHRVNNPLTDIPVKPGDSFLICADCGALNFLDAGGALRKPTDGELFYLYSSPAGPVAERALAMVRGKLRRRKA